MKAACIAGTFALLLGANVAHAELRSVAITTQSVSLASNPRIFVGARDPQTGQGDVVAHRAADGDGAAPLWSAAAMLDAQPTAARTVLSAETTALGFMLDWTLLTPAQRTWMAGYGLGRPQLDYLRGDRSQEGAASGLRPRASRMGEVVNSNLWLVRTPTSAGPSATPGSTLFVGSGDGMLHGFDAATGAETMAYVPRGLLPRLASMIGANQPPQHGVDGPIFAAQVPVGTDGAQRALLVGALGAGGKGFFVLDVGEPGQLAVRGASDLVRVDLTASTDPDIGHIHTPPVVDDNQPNRSRQIVRLNDRRWAAVMGNGYFSPRGRPVLLVQYLDGARELVKLSPCVDGRACIFEGANGLSAPQLIDLNGDGMVDVAYAGDLQGHVWKFDLSTNPSNGGNWRVAFGGQPFFTARGPDGQRQPITTAPHWSPHPHGGLMLAIGTGRHLRSIETNDIGVQSVYGLRDDSAIAIGTSSVSITDGMPIPSDSVQSRAGILVQQHYAAGRADGGVTYFDASNEQVITSGAQAHRGWWIDLPQPGQRVLQNPRGFEGQKLLVYSVRPVADANEPVGAARVWTAGDSYVSVLNMLTGHPPAQAAFVPQDASLLPTAIGMATVPSGPALQWRVSPGFQQLRFPGAQRLTLRTGTTVGARAGWREH